MSPRERIADRNIRMRDLTAEEIKRVREEASSSSGDYGRDPYILSLVREVEMLRSRVAAPRDTGKCPNGVLLRDIARLLDFLLEDNDLVKRLSVSRPLKLEILRKMREMSKGGA